MSTLQSTDQHRQQIHRFPVDLRESLTVLVDAFPEALDLASSNPPLATALASARDWDTFALTMVDREFVGGLLRQRRRRICGALGYPSSERVVRILGKVQPEACSLNLLAGVRCALRNPVLLSILSHLPTIGAAELKTAADLGSCPRLSAALFADLATYVTYEVDVGWGALLRQTETLMRLRDREWGGLRSALQVHRCYCRLWRKLFALEDFDATNEAVGFADIPFPPPPLLGSDEIQPIDSAVSLLEEARAMCHCVLSYASLVSDRGFYLYRVMHPERATLLIACRGALWQMNELAGVRNQPVSHETECIVRSWLRSARPHHSRPRHEAADREMLLL